MIYEIMKEIPGVFIYRNFHAADSRGEFIKIYNGDELILQGVSSSFRESYLTVSQKNTIRGMHFQSPPYAVDKLVTILAGEILDVIFDMRPDSTGYGKSFSINLSDSHTTTIFVPAGCAHGFLALSENATIIYNTTQPYHPESDFGIHFNSIGFNWPVDPSTIILSERDKGFPEWEKFKNPFEKR